MPISPLGLADVGLGLAGLVGTGIRRLVKLARRSLREALICIRARQVGDPGLAVQPGATARAGRSGDPAAMFGVAEGSGLGCGARGSFTHPANTAAGFNRTFSVFVDAPATNPI
jgi:hypothetical protein